MSRHIVNRIIRFHAEGFPHRMHLCLCVLTAGLWLPVYAFSYVVTKIYDWTHGL